MIQLADAILLELARTILRCSRSEIKRRVHYNGLRGRYGLEWLIEDYIDTMPSKAHAWYRPD